MNAETGIRYRETDALRTGVVEWTRGDELIGLVADAVGRLGHDVTMMSPDAPLPRGLDAVLLFGPFGIVAPLLRQLVEQPPDRRPLLVWWLTEQLWNPALPNWIARGAAELRSGIERLLMDSGPQGAVSRMRGLAGRGLRFRYYGDLLWLRRHGALSVLAVPSAWLTQFLRYRGFEVTSAPLGADPSFAAAASPARDIPVLWLGTLASRRRRNLQRITDTLARRGIEVTVVDGVRRPAVFGAERARLFSRSTIVLNLLRQPWDSNLLRFFLAAPNRALVVSEPQLPHQAVHSGTHLVEAPLERMADEVCRYLADDAARSRITEQAHRLVTTDMTIANGARLVMQQALRVRAAAGRR